MKFRKKGTALFIAAITVLCVGTTAFAAERFNIGCIDDSSIILGTSGEKEADGIAKISLDMGDTWIAQSEYVPSESPADCWTYEEYKAYAEKAANGLMEMYTAGEPELTEEDIHAWKENAEQMLAFIDAGGKVSKNAMGTDSEIIISGLDNTVIESVTEKQ